MLSPTRSEAAKGEMRSRAGLAAAKLQDENVALAQQAQRLGSTLDAHLRFSARANMHQNTVQKRLAEQQQKSENLLKSLEEVREKLRVSLVEKREMVERNEDDVARQRRAWEQERRLLVEQIEFLASRKDMSDSSKPEKPVDDATSKQSPAASQISLEKSSREEELCHLKDELQKERDKLSTERHEHHRQIRSLTSELAYFQSQSTEFQSLVKDQKRELALKDKQLLHLRQTVEGMRAPFDGPRNAAQGNCAATEGDGDLFEIMKEEMETMRTGFQEKIATLEAEVSRLQRIRK